MNLAKPINNIDKICLKIKQAYQDKGIPLPYPAANKQLQSRLFEFVTKGMADTESVCNFDKVNSNRLYTLEKQNDMVHLVMQIKEKDQATKKLIVLPVEDEIKLVVTSFIKIFEETGFIESAPKCHKRLRDTYAISDGRIRLVQRILAKYVTSAAIDNGDEDEDEDGENISQTNVIRPMPNDENLPPRSLEAGVTTRSKATLNKKCENVRKHIDGKKDEFMSLPAHLTSNASQLPFFCSSNSLFFYLDDPSTFSQVLTLYNPYDFVVRYKVLCTAPNKYSIAEPQGEIRAQHSVDTIIRLLDTSSSSTNQNVVHKIRIQFFDRRKSQDLLGKRDVVCSILSYKPSEQHFDEEPGITGTLSRNRANTTTTTTTTASSIPVPQQETRDPLVIFVLTILGAICAFILVLPTIPDNDNSLSTRIPSYLHMTTNSKVIASYILGLLTVVFIRR